MMKTVIFRNYRESVSELLDLTGAQKIFEKQSNILIKPNLVNGSKFPVTTPAACCEALVLYLKERTNAKIIIAEGCGDPSYETGEIFQILGFDKISKKYDISLIDLNHEPVVKKKDPKCFRFPEMHLPEIIYSNYLISVPVLKAHSLSGITGSLKNMVGVAPPKYYSEDGGIWNKSSFHNNIDLAIKDLNRYRTPDFSLMDATVGLVDYHLGGRECSPHINKLIAGFDPLEIDREAAGLLGIDYKAVGHLN
jgi:uncharacterized protein (DUF362 family)